MTGGNSGVGKELVSILYQHNARVWIATRSEQRSREAIDEIKRLHPRSKGEILFLSLVLDDLTTIKASAEQFLAQESRLDVVWNNAGVMLPPEGSKTVQGYELQLGVNVLGHFLFIKFLTPLLQQTAKTARPNTVRIVWVSSMAADFAPTPAIDFGNMDYHNPEDSNIMYGRAKSGNLIHAAEFQRRYSDSGIVSVVRRGRMVPKYRLPANDGQSMNPGLLKTNLQRNFSKSMKIQVVSRSNPVSFRDLTVSRESWDVPQSSARTRSCLPVLTPRSRPKTNGVSPSIQI